MVTGPMRVEAEAPEPETLIQEFLPIFLRLRYVMPMAASLVRPRMQNLTYIQVANRDSAEN
mgnify:CR=1 FL=1